MGNNAGGAAMGHGTGNCKEVGGDSTTGYIDKSSQFHRQSSSTQWTHADSFQDSFNSYTTTVNIRQDQVFHGENIIGLNNLTIGGNANFTFAAGSDIRANMAQGNSPAPAKGDRPSEPPKPKLRVIRIGAYNVAKGFQKKTKRFQIQMDSLSKGNIDWEGPINLLWDADIASLSVSGVYFAGGVLTVPCECSKWIDVAHEVFGWLSFENTSQELPFSGKLVALEVADISTPARPSVSQPVYHWTNDAGSNHFHMEPAWGADERKHALVFRAFRDQVAGTQPVFHWTNEAGSNHFHMEPAWGADERKHALVFYAFPHQAEGTQPVYHWRNEAGSNHFHMEPAWGADEAKHHTMFYAYPG